METEFDDKVKMEKLWNILPTTLPWHEASSKERILLYVKEHVKTINYGVQITKHKKNTREEYDYPVKIFLIIT